MQQTAWWVSIALMALVAAMFAYGAASSRRREQDYAGLARRAYALRARAFWVLALVLGSAMIYSLRALPYGGGAVEAGTAAQVVEAKGYLWYWELSPNRVEAGRPVEFRVSSADVNHGFGIYDPELKLVAQVQAMPGYTNVIRHTFEREGRYRILCLEYCGTVHHGMTAELTVGGN
ncbi:cytochrome C oxidase subunit II [Thauera aromatica]|uniref:cytochrome C oxidase subunit II n=1 Tax=Thauera aromatica TaxID=59405 RepID=UPI001FFDBB68|nr:cytochrome C oxidase subunit II [Thauera aromatica]MCK2095756.1 cytochrome C oxidase subunit II [Thauera aromatica]